MTPPDRQPLRVLLVDDHDVARAGVRALIEGEVAVVGEADEVGAAIDLIQEREPDVVVVDVHMPGGGGQAVIDAIAASNPGVRFVALSVSDAPQDVVGVIRAGARGYLTKDLSGPELVDGLRRIHAGDAVFSPQLAGFVLETFASFAPVDVDPDLDQLTPRELEVLRLIARGYTYKEIAGRLYISPKTIESHVSSVLRKLQLSNRHELTRWATDRGFA